THWDASGTRIAPRLDGPTVLGVSPPFTENRLCYNLKTSGSQSLQKPEVSANHEPMRAANIRDQVNLKVEHSSCLSHNIDGKHACERTAEHAEGAGDGDHAPCER